MATQLDKLGLSEFQVGNLRKLAAYLRTLPADYPDFEMVDFTTDGSDAPHTAACGTAACAVGHGPRADIAPKIGEDWFDYSERAFIEDVGGLWDWCFSSDWSRIDNTAHGAAARIEHLLSYGLPEDHYDQRKGDAKLSYVGGAL